LIDFQEQRGMSAEKNSGVLPNARAATSIRFVDDDGFDYMVRDATVSAARNRTAAG
jgi:hypothetical protein